MANDTQDLTLAPVELAGLTDGQSYTVQLDGNEAARLYLFEGAPDDPDRDRKAIKAKYLEAFQITKNAGILIFIWSDRDGAFVAVADSR